MNKEKNIDLLNGKPEDKRAEIKEALLTVFELEDNLFKTLKREESLFLSADVLRHPLIFYYGHTAAFYVNKLVLAGLLKERINPNIEAISAVGVDEMSWDDLNQAHYEWESVAKVSQFREKVKAKVLELISELPLEMPIDCNSPWWIILMSIEHQRIHIETTSVLIRQLPIDEVCDSSFFPACKEYGDAPKNEMINILGGSITIGKEKKSRYFGWDNEYGIHKADIPNLKVSKYLVSNQEFLEFVEAGGYKENHYWTDEGWGWRSYSQAEYPLFWVKKEGEWYQRNLTEEIPMPWSWPVEVNYLEAKAFCNWKSEVTGKSYRMPSEDEWYQIRSISEIGAVIDWQNNPGNINLQYCGSSSPVNKFRFGALFDVIGNVWQWTESLFYAFKGFEVYPLYEDFSTPTFDGQHNIIKGGSWASTGNLAVRDSRFAFRRHFYQHAGFRYLESSEEVQTFESDYIDDPLVVEECERGWGENEYCFANLSEELAKRSIALAKNKKKALVVGCGTGRTVFELARDFDEVEGIDSSARVFRVAVAMKAKGNIHYILKSEGDNVTIKEKYLDSYKLSSTKERVSFFQADAANLKQMYKDYDLIIAEVMLNKTYDPKHFLEMIHDRINKDGILVVAHSPQWSEEITTKDNWLGGYRGDDGEIVLSATTIDRILEKKFNKIGKSSKISYLVSNEESQMLLKVADVTFWQIR